MQKRTNANLTLTAAGLLILALLNGCLSAKDLYDHPEQITPWIQQMQEGLSQDEKMIFYEAIEVLRMVTMNRYTDFDAGWKAFVNSVVGRTPEEIVQEARRMAADLQKARDPIDPHSARE